MTDDVVLRCQRYATKDQNDVAKRSSVSRQIIFDFGLKVYIANNVSATRVAVVSRQAINLPQFATWSTL